MRPLRRGGGVIRRSVRGAGLIAAALTLAADQAAKGLVSGPLHLAQRGTIELAPIFDLKWVGNPGVSMGLLLADTPFKRWALVALTAAIAIGVLVWLWRERSRVDAIALGFVLGGATGNILDRVRFGHVVDFLDLHFGEWRPFLVFNVADAAITIGVALLLVRALLTRKAGDPVEDVNA